MIDRRTLLKSIAAALAAPIAAVMPSWAAKPVLLGGQTYFDVEHPLPKGTAIFLNGERLFLSLPYRGTFVPTSQDDWLIKACSTAEGWIDHLPLGEDGLIQVENGEIVVERVYGQVEVKDAGILPWW